MDYYNNYRALIIDDEDKLGHILQLKLKESCPEIEVVDQANCVEEAYHKIAQHNPQLIFLDIDMPGENGFELLDKFHTIEFCIIFVTGYSEYALDALKASAIDYILKPIQTDDLKAAVSKAIKEINSKQQLNHYEFLKYNLGYIRDQKCKLAIYGMDAYEFVEVNNILRCEGWNKYTKIFLRAGKDMLSSNNIGHFREILEKYEFYSPHKSHLINTNFIKKYHPEGVITMIDRSSVPLARRRREDFIQRFVKT